MKLPGEKLEQIAINTRPKIEEHTLIVMDKSAHEEHLSQPLQTNKKQFKIGVTFLIGLMVFSMLQTKKLNSILQDQLMIMVLVLFLFHQELTNFRA